MALEFYPESNQKHPYVERGEDRRLLDVGPPAERRDLRASDERRSVAPLDGYVELETNLLSGEEEMLESARLNVDEAYEDDRYAQAIEEIDSPLLIDSSNVAREALVAAQSEKKEAASKYKIRSATVGDIPAIVEVDMKSFEAVYKNYGQDTAALRQTLTETFMGRYEKVGGEWMPVLERDGKIVGFMTCCPTSKSPEDFESWEKTTDNGTLNATYDPKGKNVYVVTLSVLPEGTKGKDMLFADQIGKMLREGYERGFFESRMPGFRGWVKSQLKGTGMTPDELAKPVKDAYAEEYFGLRTKVGNKEVRKDRLLRLYERVGCKLIKVVPDAYNDDPSMNYGVVCVFDGEELFDGSMLPMRVPQNRMTRWVLGSLMQKAAKSNRITAKLFG